MEFILVMLAIGGLFFGLFSKIKYNNKQKELEEKEKEVIKKEATVYEKIVEERKGEIERDCKKRKDELDKQLADHKQNISEKISYEDTIFKNKLKGFHKEIKEIENRKNLLIKNETDLIKSAVNAEKEKQRILADQEIQQYRERKNAEVAADLELFLTHVKEQREKMENELGDLSLELETYRQKREAINAEIMRQKEIEEKQDFYRVCIKEQDIEDIQILQDLKIRLHNREAISKLIWEVYFKRPTDELVKRILQGRAPSGIYKITYLKTGQAYIGKSTDINTRWKNHIKTALGLQAIAHSTIHTEMEKLGIWNFSFEVLEECKKEELTEREKYYINLYDTKKFGYNMREG